MGCSVLPLLSAMARHIPNMRWRPSSMPADFAQNARETSSAIQLSSISAVSILAGNARLSSCSCALMRPEQRQRHIHHHQQRHHRQGQPHPDREQGGAQPDQRFRRWRGSKTYAPGGIFSRLCAKRRRTSRSSPMREEQHAGHQLREHQQDAGIGLACSGRSSRRRRSPPASPSTCAASVKASSAMATQTPMARPTAASARAQPASTGTVTPLRPHHRPLAVQRQREAERKRHAHALPERSSCRAAARKPALRRRAPAPAGSRTARRPGGSALAGIAAEVPE